MQNINGTKIHSKYNYQLTKCYRYVYYGKILFKKSKTFSLFFVLHVLLYSMKGEKLSINTGSHCIHYHL